MAKYSTERDGGEPQPERVVASWSEQPFTAVKRRRMTVEHRIVVAVHDSVGVDVCHEVRSAEYHGLPDEWTEAEVFEARDHGVSKITAEEAEWFA